MKTSPSFRLVRAAWQILVIALLAGPLLFAKFWSWWHSGPSQTMRDLGCRFQAWASTSFASLFASPNASPPDVVSAETFAVRQRAGRNRIAQGRLANPSLDE
jgi:hypothetical protein